jgi:Uma2 family endonuclease
MTRARRICTSSARRLPYKLISPTRCNQAFSSARFDELTDKNLPAVPVLAVEVLFRSGRLVDLNLKRAAHERMGTPSY